MRHSGSSYINGKDTISAPTVSIPKGQEGYLCMFRKYKDGGERKVGRREETHDPEIQQPNLGII